MEKTVQKTNILEQRMHDILEKIRKSNNRIDYLDNNLKIPDNISLNFPKNMPMYSASKDLMLALTKMRRVLLNLHTAIQHEKQ